LAAPSIERDVVDISLSRLSCKSYQSDIIDFIMIVVTRSS
jgi:hypothetical protein